MLVLDPGNHVHDSQPDAADRLALAPLPKRKAFLAPHKHVRRKRPDILSFTHRIRTDGVAHEEVGQACEPAPDHEVSRRSVGFAGEEASESMSPAVGKLVWRREQQHPANWLPGDVQVVGVPQELKDSGMRVAGV